MSSLDISPVGVSSYIWNAIEKMGVDRVGAGLTMGGFVGIRLLEISAKFFHVDLRCSGYVSKSHRSSNPGIM